MELDNGLVVCSGRGFRDCLRVFEARKGSAALAGIYLSEFTSASPKLYHVIEQGHQLPHNPGDASPSVLRKRESSTKTNCLDLHRRK